MDVRKSGGQRIRHAEMLPGDHAGQHHGDRDIDHCADKKGTKDANRQVTGWLPAFLRSGRDRIEADVREEDETRTDPHPGEAIRHERSPVLGLYKLRSSVNEEREDAELDDDHDIVHPDRFLDADDQEPGDEGDNPDGKRVEDDGDTEEFRVIPPRLKREYQRGIDLPSGRSAASAACTAER